MNKKPDFPELFFSKTKDFLDVFLLKQEGRSPETVKAYRKALSNFYDYITNVQRMNVMAFRFIDCTYNLVLSYSQYLQETRSLANSSVNQQLAALKSYLKYVSDGDIELMQVYLSVQKVPLLKMPKLQRPVLEKEELKAFLSAPEDTRFGNRDRVILILLFDSAVRVSELTGIVMRDLTMDVLNPSITIRGKGKKMRSISLNPQCAEHLKTYIAHYHTPDEPPDTPLFYTVIHGKINPMSQRNVERIVKKYADLAREDQTGMPDSVYPHMLRRSRASGMYRDGVPLEMISLILGHANTETTKIYAIPSVEQLRDALKKGNPNEVEEMRLWAGREQEIRRMFGLN